MKYAIALGAAALAGLGAMGSASAHHSFLAYQTTPFWIAGRVVRFEHLNPHTLITLEERSTDGQARRWTVEGPPEARLDRSGASDVPQIGDALEVCAFPYKSVEELSRIWPGVDYAARRSTLNGGGSAPQLVAGRVLVMPNGAKRLWEAHGAISECIRTSGEQRGSWLAFIDSQPAVRKDFCDQMAFKDRMAAPLRDFAEEIGRAIAEPCEKSGAQ